MDGWYKIKCNDYKIYDKYHNLHYNIPTMCRNIVKRKLTKSAQFCHKEVKSSMKHFSIGQFCFYEI